MSADPLVLASASPQRRAILQQLGVAFEVRPTHVEEVEEGDPEDVARTNALRKAQAGASASPDRTVLGVDTVVTLEGALLGKPEDAAHAEEMIARLQGREHTVMSGIAVCEPGADGPRALVQATTVRFVTLGPAAVAAYVATGEWEGRAGGYAIQGRGAAIVDGITGDYLNVVGLPVPALRTLLPGLLTP